MINKIHILTTLGIQTLHHQVKITLKINIKGTNIEVISKDHLNFNKIKILLWPMISILRVIEFLINLNVVLM